MLLLREVAKRLLRQSAGGTLSLAREPIDSYSSRRGASAFPRLFPNTFGRLSLGTQHLGSYTPPMSSVLEKRKDMPISSRVRTTGVIGMAGGILWIISII